MLKGELFNQIVHREKVIVAVKTCAHLCDPVGDSFRNVAEFGEIRQENSISLFQQFFRFTFGEFAFSAGAQQHGKVDPFGFVPAQSLIDHVM